MKHIMRIILPLSIFLVVCVGSQPVQAGVVVDSNGIVTEFTETTYSQNTYYFYEGSYDSTSSTSVTISDAGALFYFSEGLAAALESLPRSVSLDTTVSYVMASSEVNTTVTVHEVIKDPDSADWLTRSNAFYASSATNNGSQTFYFASLTAPTGGSTGSVPEPSTAIAMGLLGIVGFAGNRRRRRQVSAA